MEQSSLQYDMLMSAAAETHGKSWKEASSYAKSSRKVH